MKVKLFLTTFLGTDIENIRSFAFYLALRELSHEGSIHNYKSIQHILKSKIGISDSCFRKKLNDCIRLGYISKQSTHLIFKSHKKIELELKEQYQNYFKNKTPKTYIYTQFKKYKQIIYWLKAVVLNNNINQQKFIEKKEHKRVNGKYFANNNSAFTPKVQLSRKTIARLTGRKSATTGINIMRKLKSLGMVEKDTKVIKLLRPMSKLEYNHTIFNRGKFFLRNGNLYQSCCNDIEFKNVIKIKDCNR